MFRYLWASPYTLLGICVGAICWLRGARIQRQQGVCECTGPGTEWFLDRLPLANVSAITLGHVIVGRNPGLMQRVRTHEHVHVRQFERWGPLMGPAYLVCSAWLWLRGRDYYRENPFEREAFHDDHVSTRS